jgi:hypothetical protein
MMPDDVPGSAETNLLRRALPIPGRFDVTRAIDAEKVVKVALNPDDELRNLQVALLYSLSSARLDDRLALGAPADQAPPTHTNANWFTIAQWAVLTVGRNMRSTEMPHRASVLPQGLRRRLTPLVLSLRSADDRRIAAALSYGQVMVFVSVYHALLSTEFADDAYLPEPPHDPHAVKAQVRKPVPDRPATSAGDDEAPASEEVTRLAKAVGDYVLAQQAKDPKAEQTDQEERQMVLTLAEQMKADVHLIREDPPEEKHVFYERVLEALATVSGYKEHLDDAFALYRRAAQWNPEQRAEPKPPDHRTPADLIFEANLRIAAIEQVILDGAVTQVVEHVPRHITEQTEGRLATFAERTFRLPRRIAEMNAHGRMVPVAAIATEAWARIMTDQVMVVAFPAETIRLGRDIPLRDWRKAFYAPDLTELSPEAADLFEQFDRSLGDGRGAGAGDWRRFDDRLNFVANLLRSRQQEPSLFWQPFTDEDVVRVWNGSYPSRIADPFEQAVRSPSFYVDIDGLASLDTKSSDEVVPNKVDNPSPPTPVGGDQ